MDPAQLYYLLVGRRNKNEGQSIVLFIKTPHCWIPILSTWTQSPSDAFGANRYRYTRYVDSHLLIGTHGTEVFLAQGIQECALNRTGHPSKFACHRAL